MISKAGMCHKIDNLGPVDNTSQEVKKKTNTNPTHSFIHQTFIEQLLCARHFPVTENRDEMGAAPAYKELLVNPEAFLS